MATISLDRVSFAYPGRTPRPFALRDVSCVVEEGEICALVGPSGSGKSTLIRLIAGLLQPSMGDVYVSDEPVRGPSPHVGVVFQEYSRSLLPWRTVEANVSLACARVNGGRPAREAISDPIEQVGLGHVRDSYPWELSGGMQQRVAIARVLALDSPVILLDEPFGSVDAVTRFALEDLVLTAARQFKLTVLLVTHDIDEAVYMADRVMVMTKGGTLDDAHGIPVALERPRSQLGTRHEQTFLDLRSQLLQAVSPDYPEVRA